MRGGFAKGVSFVVMEWNALRICPLFFSKDNVISATWQACQAAALGDHIVFQAGKTDGFVRAVRVGLRILGTGDQYLRVRENTLQFRNERNRATFALLTGATPNASSMASMASLVASAFGSMAQPMPLSSLSTHTSAPNGACSTMNLASAS